ncbi:MAG TPA: hypothetical protein VFI02_22035 [Armatimonadota bacterium]|nr:hypothetical protein [Armatimonadota bacterium]
MTEDRGKRIGALEDELAGIDKQIEGAVRAGDEERLLKLTVRKRILPVQIGELRLADLEEQASAEAAEAERLIEDWKEKRSDLERAESALQSAQNSLKEAQSAVQQAGAARVRSQARQENLQKQIDTLKARIEGHVSAATG